MTNSDSIPTIALKAGGGKRAKRGRPWIFSNEIVHAEPKPEPGCLVRVNDDRGKFVGLATYNPHSLIALRLLSRDPGDAPGTAEWFGKRLSAALELRGRLCPGRTGYRLVHGDADGLPGVVIDRYNDVYAVQILTAGMERLTGPLLEAIKEAFAPKAAVLRNGGEMRALEHLPLYDRIEFGELPDPLLVSAHGLEMEIDALHGQKTGHFWDQHENREALLPLANGAEALDLFCYSGAWGLSLLKAGAESAAFVDSSAPAVAMMKNNARRNGLDNRAECFEGNAFEALSELRRQGRRFDIVVCDPPAFAKSGKQKMKALRGYEDLNRQALHLVRSGGILCTCTCSHHVSDAEFLSVLENAAGRERKQVNVLELRGQARDHPAPAALPEARYLTCVIAAVKPL